MAVISISITESEIQLISGIPKFVAFETNIPATIFYTLDNSTPNTNSSIYLDNNLILPTDQNSVHLKLFATNGVDTSSMISRIYHTDITDLRMSHDTVVTSADSCEGTIFPYASEHVDASTDWRLFGPTGSIVDNPDIQGIPDGYDGTATNTSKSETDLPQEQLLLLFSETNSTGERGRGIGTLPHEVTFPVPVNTKQSSNINDKFFDAKAMVIYQDSRDEPFDVNVAQLNRQYFSLDNPEKNSDGLHYGTSAYDGLQNTGSFLRAHFNPRENTTTYYYLDARSLRWIISKEPGKQSPGFETIATPRQRGAGKVFKWLPFMGRGLI